LLNPCTSVSHELTHSLRDQPSEPPSLLALSEDIAARVGSLLAVCGTFSTSSRGDPPTRGSRPASFRLRRFCDLDGLLPPQPCRLVSSGGTRGVPWPGRLLSGRRSNSRASTPAGSPWSSSVSRRVGSKLPSCRMPAGGRSEELLLATHEVPHRAKLTKASTAQRITTRAGRDSEKSGAVWATPRPRRVVPPDPDRGPNRSMEAIFD
jgi:hypothetical protein